MYTADVYYNYMLRTQIYIPEKLHQRAKLLAQKKNKPMADLLRQFIEQGLTRELKKSSSDNLDKYLYADK